MSPACGEQAGVRAVRWAVEGGCHPAGAGRGESRSSGTRQLLLWLKMTFLSKFLLLCARELQTDLLV